MIHRVFPQLSGMSTFFQCLKSFRLFECWDWSVFTTQLFNRWSVYNRGRSVFCVCFVKILFLIGSGYEPSSVCHLQSVMMNTVLNVSWPLLHRLKHTPHAFQIYERLCTFEPRGRDEWLPFNVLEFGKSQAEIMGGKGHSGEVFSSVSVGELQSKVKRKSERKWWRRWNHWRRRWENRGAE